MPRMIDNFNNLRGIVTDPATKNYKIGDHIELINESILRLIFTRKGTRPGNLEYGTNIPDIPFTQNTEAILNILSYEISEAMAKWEPRAIFMGVQLQDIIEEFMFFYLVFQETLTNTRQTLPVMSEFV